MTPAHSAGSFARGVPDRLDDGSPIMSIDLASLADKARRFAAPLAEALPPTPTERIVWNGRTLWIKREDLQETGSFKVRGALVRLASIDWAILRFGVVTASHGNHGLGLAWAAGRLGTLATIVVPNDTPRVKCDGIRALGAELVVHDAPGYDAAEREARRLATERNATFVSAFDDPWVQAGNGGTVALEIMEQVPTAGRIVVPVGGGGIASGLAAVIRTTWPLIDVWGVQSEACPSMAASIRDGRAHLVWEGGPTYAEGLEGGVAESTFAICRRELVGVPLVSEAAIARAMTHARRAHGMRLEGCAAVVLAAVDEGVVPCDEDTVVVLTGSNVDDAVLDRAAAEADA